MGGGLLLHLHAVEDDGDDGLHLIRAGLRNQDNESHQRGICHALFAIDEKCFVAIQKIEENGGGYAFIAIGKAVIFDDEVQETRRFFLQCGVELHPAEALVYVAEGAAEKRMLSITWRHSSYCST